jgi:adenylate cyclase
MPDPAETGLITSKKILDKTGISRATLNNYIKMGILPKPIVKKGGPELKGVKQIGYFAADVIERINTVRRLKREGMAMAEIARHMSMEIEPQEGTIPGTDKGVEETGPPGLDKKTDIADRPDTQQNSVTSVQRLEERYLPSMEEIAKKFRDRPTRAEQDGMPSDQKATLKRREAGYRTGDKDLKLSIGELHTPAYLINHNFEIEWVNTEAETEIFNKGIGSIIDIESRNIFKLFFSWEFHIHLRNWEEIIAAHMAIVKNKINKNDITNLYSGITDKETRFLEKIYDVESSPSEDAAHHTPLSFISQDGEQRSYQIYTMSFREGIFCVYVPDDRSGHELMKILANRGRVIQELLNERMPSLISLCVMVADIQDSVKICGELLPEEYFEMVNQLWKTVGCSLENFNGIYGKHAGDGMLYYFLKRPGTNYIMDAINCAIDMRERMKEFSSSWRLRKGWFNDIYLNTAINEGQEFFGAIHSATNVEFTALGDSINYTSRLSDFARYGAIWTTKNVISKLSQEDRSRIRFGVHRRNGDRDVFLENSFSRIMDLTGEKGQNYSQFMDVATLPITEIIELLD